MARKQRAMQRGYCRRRRALRTREGARASALPRVLLLHTGGTLGMDPERSIDQTTGTLVEGTGGRYLEPSVDLASCVIEQVPEIESLASITPRVAFNLDSSRVGVNEWLELAMELHQARDQFDAFVCISGTDTMAYLSTALSFLLAGFGKPIIVTGSTLPLAKIRSDARQNLIDSICCCTTTEVQLKEVCICFGGVLLRGNRARKVNSSLYSAFESPGYPPLARLGVSIEWNVECLLSNVGVYRPRFALNPNVIRVPICPSQDPFVAYGDLAGRGVCAMLLEVFGTGNMPDLESDGWLPWIRWQRDQGLYMYLISQCDVGQLHPELYRAGAAAMEVGVETGPQLTPEAAIVKLMFCLEQHQIPVAQPIAGEL